MAAGALEYENAMSSDALDRLESEAFFGDAGKPVPQISHAAERPSIHRAAHQRIVHTEDPRHRYPEGAEEPIENQFVGVKTAVLLGGETRPEAGVCPRSIR